MNDRRRRLKDNPSICQTLWLNTTFLKALYHPDCTGSYVKDLGHESELLNPSRY